MSLNKLSGTGYLCSGTIWKDALTCAESLISISFEQKSRPANSSISCVMIAQPGEPSGQNQINGILSMPCALREQNSSRSIRFSTVRSTGQLGKGILDHLLK